jgi:hypothetical protein
MATVLPPTDHPTPDVAPDRLLASDGADVARCVSCGAPGMRRFCAECGEKRVEPGDHTLRHVLGELADQLLSLDGRATRTLKALVTRPGFLTAEYVAGRRQPYSKPLSFFLLLNVVFFLAAPHLSLIQYDLSSYLRVPPRGVRVLPMVRAKLGARPAFDASMASRQGYARRSDAYVERFDGALDKNRQSLLTFLVPAVGLVVMGLQIRRGRTYVEHLVFSLHAITWMLLLLLVAVPLVARPLALHVLAPAVQAMGSLSNRQLNRVLDSSLALFIAVAFAGYLSVALRRVYGDRRRTAVVKAVVLATAFMALFLGYRTVLFLFTYYTL